MNHLWRYQASSRKPRKNSANCIDKQVGFTEVEKTYGGTLTHRARRSAAAMKVVPAAAGRAGWAGRKKTTEKRCRSSSLGVKWAACRSPGRASRWQPVTGAEGNPWSIRWPPRWNSERVHWRTGYCGWPAPLAALEGPHPPHIYSLTVFLPVTLPVAHALLVPSPLASVNLVVRCDWPRSPRSWCSSSGSGNRVHHVLRAIIPYAISYVLNILCSWKSFVNTYKCFI